MILKLALSKTFLHVFTSVSLLQPNRVTSHQLEPRAYTKATTSYRQYLLIKLDLITPQYLYSQFLPLLNSVPALDQSLSLDLLQAIPSGGRYTVHCTLQRTPTMVGGRLASLASRSTRRATASTSSNLSSLGSLSRTSCHRSVGIILAHQKNYPILQILTQRLN